MIKKLHSAFVGIASFVQVFLAVVLLAAFAFFLSALFASRTQQLEPSAQSLFPTLTTGVDQTDPTAEWNMYEDKELGFSIKFPNDWYYQENPDFQQPRVIPDALETKVMFANFPPPFLGPASYMPEGCRFDVLVATTEKDPKHQLKAARYEQIGVLGSPASGTSVTVRGIEGIRRTYLPDKKAVRQTRTVVLLPGSNNLFAFYFWKEKDEPDATCDDVFETILQTFALHW